MIQAASCIAAGIRIEHRLWMPTDRTMHEKLFQVEPGSAIKPVHNDEAGL